MAAIVQMLAHEIPVQRLAPPAAAMEYARRLAQRGVSVNALVRAYRVGHDRLLSWAFDEIDAVVADREVSALATRRVVADTFAYVDRISEQVVAAYEEEQQRWLAQHSTERAARIRDLLDGAGPGSGGDLDAAEAALGYPLRGRHLGLVVWAADAQPTRSNGSCSPPTSAGVRARRWSAVRRSTPGPGCRSGRRPIRAAVRRCETCWPGRPSGAGGCGGGRGLDGFRATTGRRWTPSPSRGRRPDAAG